jgi:hypothetical protein
MCGGVNPMSFSKEESMNINVTIVREGFDGVTCYAQSRIGAADQEGKHLVLTTQKLILAGSDTYKPIESAYSLDGGKTWSSLVRQEKLEPENRILCDFVPAYHRRTGKLLGTGGSVTYKSIDPPVLDLTQLQKPFYSVYDEQKNEWGKVKTALDYNREECKGFTFACIRRFELDNGDILQPTYGKYDTGSQKSSVKVFKFGFDGEELVMKDEGNLLSCEEEKRGLGEPSIVYYSGMYYLTIRADSQGYVSRSEDGLHFDEPVVWKWDTGYTVPTYNTQQNWVVRHDGLYLVYTRKDGKNDHVFRNRAPLYMCKVDADRLCLLRATERAITPERGARMGNFGVTHISDHASIVVTTEWMQPLGCEKYGSNNAIYAVYITD